MWDVFIYAVAAAFMVWTAYLWMYKISNRGYLFIRKNLFRDRIVECYGFQYDFMGARSFKTPIYIDEEGKAYGYRYPENKIGPVSFRQDGTGFYCGNLSWKEV